MKSMFHYLHYLNINSVTELNQTALMLAISQHHTEVIDYLINIGCDLNIEDKYGENALSLAIRFRNRSLIKTLHSKGCIISEKILQKNDPLIEFELELFRHEDLWKVIKPFIISHLKIKRNYL